MQKYINENFEKISNNFIELKNKTSEIEKVANECIKAIKNGNKIMFCGNGGSASDSQHLAAELVGRYKKNRQSLPAIALTVDTSILTAVGNDFGFDTVFSRQVEGLGKKGDVLIGISTSGNSTNVVKAIEQAKSMGIVTVGFTGQKGGEMRNLVDYLVNVPSDVANTIQEMHIAIGHILCGIIENEVCNE